MGPETSVSQARIETVVAIQYLRAVAASLVVFQHAMNVPVFAHYVAHFGTFGVDLFFVISGYIMWTTAGQRDRGPRTFWLARIVRIVPLYWIFTATYIAAALITPESFTVMKLDLTHIIKSFLFVPADHPTLGLVMPVYTLGWTLNYEMFFYLVFGLCLFVASRRLRFILLIVVFLGLVVFGMVVQPRGPVLRTYVDPIMLEFVAGVVLAVLSPYLMRCGMWLGVLLLAVAALWVGTVYGQGIELERIVAHGLPAIIAVAGTVMIERVVRKHPSRIGLLLGDASYSIYLAHPFAQRLWLIGVNKTIGLSAVSPTVYVVAAFLIGIGGGVICYLLVERPLLRIGRRLIGRPQPTR